MVISSQSSLGLNVITLLNELFQEFSNTAISNARQFLVAHQKQTVVNNIKIEVICNKQQIFAGKIK